jgi:hypothetical protein
VPVERRRDIETPGALPEVQRTGGLTPGALPEDSGRAARRLHFTSRGPQKASKRRVRAPRGRRPKVVGRIVGRGWLYERTPRKSIGYSLIWRKVHPP